MHPPSGLSIGMQFPPFPTVTYLPPPILAMPMKRNTLSSLAMRVN